MPTILGAAASGLIHNQNVLDTVAHNLANANTAAFKTFRALHQGLPNPEPTPETSRLGVATTTRDLLLHPGALLASESPLHAALQDAAFFIVTLASGEAVFTRYGGFQLDRDGTLVDGAGRIVPDVNGDPIRLPAGLVSPYLDAGGALIALDADGRPQEVARLPLARFPNPQGLELLGGGLYRPTPNSGDPEFGTPGDQGFAPLRPGALESSNVDVAEEFVSMIVAQRAYSACAKTFAVGDAMLEIATRITR